MEGPVGKVKPPSKYTPKVRLTIGEEITPLELRCTFGTCQAVLTASDGDLIVIGKKLPADLSKAIQGRVGSDEFAIKISPEFFKNLRK
jgi:hypothetical protein